MHCSPAPPLTPRRLLGLAIVALGAALLLHQGWRLLTGAAAWSGTLLPALQAGGLLLLADHPGPGGRAQPQHARHGRRPGGAGRAAGR
jgi:hypothetical protein